MPTLLVIQKYKSSILNHQKGSRLILVMRKDQGGFLKKFLKGWKITKWIKYVTKRCWIWVMIIKLRVVVVGGCWAVGASLVRK